MDLKFEEATQDAAKALNKPKAVDRISHSENAKQWEYVGYQGCEAQGLFLSLFL